MNNFLADKDDQEKDEDYQDSVEKLSALYGEEWKDNYPENLMNEKYFKKIPEFLKSKSKILTRDTVSKTNTYIISLNRLLIGIVLQQNTKCRRKFGMYSEKWA